MSTLSPKVKEDGDMTNIKRWEHLCKSEAPYPLNYLPYSQDPTFKNCGIMIGMMIENGVFK